MAAELRECAKRETSLQSELHGCNESLTQAEVALQRVRDHVAELERELEVIAIRLELDAAAPAETPLPDSEREALRPPGAVVQAARTTGPVNPLAQQEYAEAVEHVEELERQRDRSGNRAAGATAADLDTDRQIRELFERTFTAAARNFEQVCSQLFPGGRGRLRLLAEHEGPALCWVARWRVATSPGREMSRAHRRRTELGVEIEINPPVRRCAGSRCSREARRR